MRKISHIATTALLLVTVALGACGSDEETLTKAEWTEQADAICKKTNDETEEAGEDAFGDLGEDEAPEPAELEEFVDEVVPLYRRQIADIRELNEPEDISDEVDEMLAAAEKGIDELDDADGDELLEMFNSEDEDDPFAKVTEIAEDLDMEDCAE